MAIAFQICQFREIDFQIGLIARVQLSDINHNYIAKPRYDMFDVVLLVAVTFVGQIASADLFQEFLEFLFDFV